MAHDTLYGRTSDEWADLVREGLRFLTEQARLKHLTTYTEMNAVLERRTDIRPFDFNLDSERAAMGELLYRIVERDMPTSGLMMSALVKYLNENDAGSGFYRLAEQYKLLRPGASAHERTAFWADQVNRIFASHERPRRPDRRRAS